MAFPVMDAIGYQLSSLSLDDKPSEAPYALPTILPTIVYRILRPDENPDGIVAKNPETQRSVLSHVNCGSRPNYASQFISSSASLEVAEYYKKKGEEKGLTGLRIGMIEVDKLPPTCQIIDLTNEENRDQYLRNAVCKVYATRSAEVLLRCSEPIPCTVIPSTIRQTWDEEVCRYSTRTAGGTFHLICSLILKTVSCLRRVIVLEREGDSWGFLCWSCRFLIHKSRICFRKKVSVLNKEKKQQYFFFELTKPMLISVISPNRKKMLKILVLVTNR